MVINERENREERVLEAARLILTAGRTAPKGKGVDNLELLLVTGNTLNVLAQAMRTEAERTGMKFFLRDADNIEQAEAVILVGTRTLTMGLNCGYCGYPTCAAKTTHEQTPCTLNSVDVGIAIGSMVSLAADLRVDNRVMFSAGYAAHSVGLMTGCGTVLAIPLSASSKSPFFDRVHAAPAK